MIVQHIFSSLLGIFLCFLLLFATQMDFIVLGSTSLTGDLMIVTSDDLTPMYVSTSIGEEYFFLSFFYSLFFLSSIVFYLKVKGCLF